MKKEKDWFKDRGYPHFSDKTPLALKRKIISYVSNPIKVSHHSFFPLIQKELKQRRYKESKFNENLKRSHKKEVNGKLVSNTKIREILYATHIDAHLYSYYAQKIIAPKYEEHLKKNLVLSNSITAYRQIKIENQLKYKNNIHFAKDVFDEIKRRQNCVALVLDIENFFPTLNHKLLKLAWAKIIGHNSLPKDHYNIFKSTTRFSYVKLNDLRTKNGHFDEKKLSKYKKTGKNTFFEKFQDLLDSNIIIHKNQKVNSKKEIIGIPQGLPISALLANIYMLKFDEAVVDNLVLKNDIFYRRYSDDIVLVCKINQIELIEKFIIDEIEKIDLKISLEKTEKTLFKINNNRLESFKLLTSGTLKNNIPLNYLGFEFYGYQTLIRSKNLANFYRQMKQTIKRKHKRVESIKEIKLLDTAPIFKRKIYRLYSFKGIKGRKLPKKITLFRGGKTVTKEVKKKFRGNYIKYAYEASSYLEAPEIKRQVRNHWKILQNTIQKYDFSNSNKSTPE
ncbi:reverse transcriptase domain-containing protein [Arenibacter palladensis]|uniref:reverse transcriptase domain-containing protein n=1 Tax=Arenibacter palladensis TaxID=237373 RepID=UPI002FCE6FDE